MDIKRKETQRNTFLSITDQSVRPHEYTVLYTALTSVYLTSFAVFGLNLYIVKRVIPTWWL